MSKSVLLSIKPKYCELIASGKKTIEIRKNRPKTKEPFKCYIYCTKEKSMDDVLWTGDLRNVGIFAKRANGKVIGEFACKNITSYRICMGIPNDLIIEGVIAPDEIWEYSNKGCKDLFAWHISDLVIYNKPKELDALYHFDKYKPPQSWCYVEDEV